MPLLDRSGLDLPLDAIHLADQIESNFRLSIEIRIGLRLTSILELAAGVGIEGGSPDLFSSERGGARPQFGCPSPDCRT
jgi:hypothetical protein